MNRIFLLLLVGLLCRGCSHGACSARDTRGYAGDQSQKRPPSVIRPMSTNITSLANAVRMLGRTNGLDIELRDERKKDDPLGKPTKVQFQEGQFWSDLAKIERLFNVNFQWLGQADGNRAVVVRLLENSPRIWMAYIAGRFRIVLSSRPEESLNVQGAKPSGPVAHVTLDYLPGDRVLAARWRPNRGQVTPVLWGIPHWGTVDLGTLRLAKADALAGSVEVVVGVKWEQVTLQLSPGSKVSLPTNSPISDLRFVQLGGTDFNGPPGSSIGLKQIGPEKLAAYVVTFAVNGRYQGVLPCVPSECCIVDIEGNKHQASELGVGNSSVGKEQYFAVFPSWQGNAAPVKMEMRIPVQTSNISLEISNMSRLPYLGK